LRSHEHFEELAAIAALGELPSSQVEELRLHLAECPHCTEISDAYVRLHGARPALSSETLDLIESRRESVKAAVFNKIQAAQTTGNGPQATVRRSFGRFAWSGVAVAVAAAFFFWLGARYEQNVLSASKPNLRANTAQALQKVPNSAASDVEIPVAALSQAATAQVTEQLRIEKLRSAKLDAELGAASRSLDNVEQERASLRQQLETQAEESRRTQSLLSAKAEELNRIETTTSNDSDAVVALRYQVQDLTDKLTEQKASLDRERELLASGRDIRNIIGARNLHIIDVYDTDPEGKTKTSFARAFYTEGKSLIFYAYDLPAKRTEEGKFVYAAWGEKNGDKKRVRNLGILLNDDKGQKRWVLNFSDPKVLAEIDSVFITLEQVGKDEDGPNGKRLLTAYLESQPNHP
jgi:hypothetical protein